MISDFRLDVLILRVAAVLLALAIHEYAHAAAAVRLGDPGPKFDGRLTLNPLAHLDPVGTLMLFFFSFGWAKPVMVNPARFKNPRRDMMWVALAGPLSNIALAFALARLAPFILNIVPPGALRATWMFLQVSVQLNIWLAVFNMLPLPPLDGSKVLMGILPRRYAYRYARLESYGTVILLLLVVSGMLFRVLQPAYSAVARLVVG
ncbi:MAG: site-2 protease family protein [Bacillota bacterium]|nr:MAG: site-2 protease family protein [Bacillota bacterium]